jgi:hypothetical protein
MDIVLVEGAIEEYWAIGNKVKFCLVMDMGFEIIDPLVGSDCAC